MAGTSGVNTTPTTVDGADIILSPEALGFLADLHRTFGARRRELLARRQERRAEIARTGKLDFLAETAPVRDDPDWRVADAPADLQDRRVEITGPTDPKMTINALNSGAKVWLADLEDANTPHWDNVVGGQVSLYRATRRALSFESNGKQYQLGENLAVVVTRPRGWHLDEEHITVDGEPIAGALVDFGLYFFHNARELLNRGSGPYFYLPKTESHLEARLWNDVFTHAEQALGLNQVIRATVLIETITAAFEMEEILYELREHASGLNAGRWDYLFSVIKNFRDAGPEFVLPDRAKVTMTAPFMRAYTELLVATCHRRGAFAMGGMAAFIPSRRDPEVNAKALEQVKADKEREANDGFDGSWVAHPDLVPVCRDAFDAVLGDKPNQLDRLRPDVDVAASDLLDVANTPGDVTEDGVRANVSVALQYLKAWIGGLGAVAINNLMEDAATAEISRSQIWQWINQGTILADTGEPVTKTLVRRILDEEVGKLGDGYDQARTLFEQVALADDFVDFLTLPAYALVR
ncbi:malate synthase A [Cryptosporangium phraense]|uniref:malate synthase A n=1 Tax=Cryptosporangium phraense TaxID=2593070 RepID=UPI001F1107A8|nr:malate synthase A [Cryptosporangium phraense]